MKQKAKWSMTNIRQMQYFANQPCLVIGPPDSI